MISLMTFCRGVALGRLLQGLQVRNQVRIYEGEVRATRAFHEFIALGSAGRGPILPAVWRDKRRLEIGFDGSRFFNLPRLAFVQNPQEKNPRQFGHILHRPGAVAPAHDVADAPNGSVDGALRGERASGAKRQSPSERTSWLPSIQIQRLRVCYNLGFQLGKFLHRKAGRYFP